MRSFSAAASASIWVLMARVHSSSMVGTGPDRTTASSPPDPDKRRDQDVAELPQASVEEGRRHSALDLLRDVDVEVRVTRRHE
jgi:hypothetical protein